MLDDEKLVLLFSETELSLVTEFCSYSELERTIPLPFLRDPTSTGSYCLRKASWRKRSCCVAVSVIVFSLRNCCYCMRCERYEHVDWFNIQEIEISDAEQSRYTRMTDVVGHLSSAVYRNQLRSTHKWQTSTKRYENKRKSDTWCPLTGANFKNMRHLKPEH